MDHAHSTDAAKLSRVPKLPTPEFPTNTDVPADDPHGALTLLSAAATHIERMLHKAYVNIKQSWGSWSG